MEVAALVDGGIKAGQKVEEGGLGDRGVGEDGRVGAHEAAVFGAGATLGDYDGVWEEGVGADGVRGVGGRWWVQAGEGGDDAVDVFGGGEGGVGFGDGGELGLGFVEEPGVFVVVGAWAVGA